MKIINNRYEIVRLMDRDNNIVEYLVTDLEKSGALKRIRIFDTEMSNYDFIKQLEDSFVDVKTIVHENVLSAYEFQPITTINGNRVNRKQYFYTYEHYEESEVVSYIELNKSEINSVIVQLCKAVRFLHFRGIVYKFLNFNQMVILRQEGQIVLKIKDVASNYINDYYFKMDHERFGQFVAPEIIWGEETDERVDIYSLGSMIYYLYYRLDYNQKSMQNIISASHNNDIHRFIKRATSHIIDERHETIHHFINELSKLIWIEIGPTDVKYYDRIHESTRIIGRDALIKEIKQSLDAKYKKTLSQHALLIQGEYGSGKSRLLKEIYYISKFSRYNYLMLRPSDFSDAFYTTRSIVRYISEQDDVSPLLIQKYGQELVSLVPELATKWNIKEVGMIQAKTQYLRVLNRVFNFFLDYTSNKFTILLIDDIEKISPIEQSFYDQLLEHRGPSNYYLIFTGIDSYEIDPKVQEMVKVSKLSSLNLEETGLIVKSSLGLKEIPYKLTHRLMLENQGKASSTKRMIKKLWYDGAIYFDENKMSWHLDNINDAFDFDYFDHRKEDIDHMVNHIKSQHYEILRKLSVLKGSFSMHIIFKLADIDEETGYYFLYEMEEKRILNKRISDVEYVFVFSTNELKKIFYDTLSNEEISELSKAAAILFEEKFINEGVINEQLIDYFLACNEDKSAAKYCDAFANHYFEKSNSHKGIDLLEQGVDIYLKLQATHEVVQTTHHLIKQLIKVGKLDRAIEKIAFLSAYVDPEDAKTQIDVQIDYANILFYKNDVTQCEAIADLCLEEAQNCNYLEGEFRSAYIKCKCLISNSDLETHLKVLNFYLEKSKGINDIFQQAVFENERGINYLYKNQFDDSIEAFTLSLKHYKSIEDDENIVKAYNNFGVIYLDGYGDYTTARDYFRKAYTRANKRNYLVSLPVYLNNLGETYRMEGRYEMAINYFEEAYQMAEDVGDKNMTILSLLNLCHSQILHEKYGKAHKLMSRLEHEVQIIKKRDYDKFDYYLLHFDYFLSMNAVMKSNQWRYAFDADEVVDDYRKYRLKIIDLRLQYKRDNIVLSSKSEQVLDKKIALEEIESLFAVTKNPAEAKLMRELLLDLLIDKIEENDYLNAERLLEMDGELTKYYNTKIVRLKRAFIEASFSDFAIERITGLIDQIKEQSLEFLWRVYNVLGNAYYDKRNTYESLKYYLMSLDIIADLTATIPYEFKETYILHDDVKMSLKNRINKMIRILLNFEGTKQGLIIEGRIDTVEDFFDLNQFNLLYNNSEFIKLVSRNYNINEQEKFENTTELIKNFEKDEIYNLKCILNYLQQITIGERAFIYLVDENDNFGEVIKADEHSKPYDIARLINSFGNDIDGIHISKLNPNTSTQLLVDDQKGLICFPIYESSAHKNPAENRRDDLFSSKNKITGYVFLDSTNVINRFNEYTFNQAKSFINLIYVFIDNYNLKKLSTIDKLTGVYLRKFIEQQFALQMSISRQKSYSLSVIMLDIDKFKNVNDTYGHRKGDEILTKIGELLIKSVRNSDFVGRYGGEEFIILLPETDAVSGFKVAEKIRSIIESANLLGEEMPLTVSLGISTYPEDGANEEELIEKADQALYYSKNNGRNRSTSWDEKLIKEGHRYDRLTGILTGNISSDTRNMQALLSIINQLDHSHSRMEGIKNTFISLLDITEGDEIQFIRYDKEGNVADVLYKKKGENKLKRTKVLSERIMNQYRGVNTSQFFIDWEENLVNTTTEEDSKRIPDWKSYIVMSFGSEEYQGILSISVSIKVKEFDFSNFNFVESLRPVLEHLLF